MSSTKVSLKHFDLEGAESVPYRRSNSRKSAQYCVFSELRFVNSRMTEHPQIGRLKCLAVNQYHLSQKDSHEIDEVTTLSRRTFLLYAK